MNDKMKDILEWIYCILIAIAIAILIKYFLITPTIVQQESMKPTFMPGDRLLLSRISRTMKKLPERGDIITFEAPSDIHIDEAEAETMSQPIAKYENEPTSIWGKFVHNVLEIGKVSYIKRVIALPGEHVLIQDGKVYINGEELHEDYLKSSVTTERTGAFYDFVVPEYCVFAMGDNRSVSGDCRAFGCIPKDKIESKAVFRFWPLNKFGSTKNM